MQIYVEHWGGWFGKIDHFSILGEGRNDLAKLIIFLYMGGRKLAIQLLALPIIGLVHSFCLVAHPESGKGGRVGGNNRGSGCYAPSHQQIFTIFT